MATSIVMPQMGYDMQQGTVVRWRKSEGDEVTRGDVLAEIETDKATVEFEAYVSGVLRRIVVDTGVVVPVGELIAVIGGRDEQLPDHIQGSSNSAPAASAPTVEAQPAPEPPSPAAAGDGEVRASPIARRLARERGVELSRIAGTGPGGRIVEQDVLDYQEPTAVDGATPLVAVDGSGRVERASPIARRLARERGIELASVTGTGPEGRIVEQDVLNYQPPTPEAEAVPAQVEAEGERAELSRMRQVIARVTSDSKRDAPHFYLTATVDMSRAMDLRREVNDVASSETRISVNDLIVKASAIALRRHAKFNAFFRGEHLQMNSSLNIGIAIALEAGLIVPGIGNCENRSLVEIASASSDLIARAHQGTLRNEEYSGTTFSISNLGMFDVDSFAAIIYPPHAAVLAVGKVSEQPVVRDGQLAVGQTMQATLSVDHRVADGAEAAQFLMEIKGLLESPVSLLL